ncbi:homoserine dehydrogenase, putative [Perkinsus marinus ATCC 50983]|uniref:Homoserine dehydrogenase n=1 Tax=Perkinsus marinus (strain ATCC 50983 / TXsc) TaxID=423536 RepID=C5L870_PERM5|nr:homoserine dehydrogenase, putative [Perkinsus marinus ATCC 50983]EER07096.1 homoserine dehydrogenase, putative [Perkinsus marinus ATCC 50983]|eukprot:XP_002775280.1 homoserine dehydrogenase, putative [Perkinsus marinus ATCC 50983]
MLGFGVVGGGVVELLKPYEHIISLVKICVRDVGKSRDVALPDGCEVVTDAQCIFDDASIDIVIEVMGGTDTAWTYTKHAMEAGKHIVTANKALISKYMDAIEKLALENNVQFLYEAAVCGGIPIVNTALRGLRADTFNHISGIMNGSTNYILSRMEHEGVSYDEAGVSRSGS